MSAGEAMGEALCPTVCDPDCDADCHEEHQVSYKRKHRPERCPGREPVSNERVEELFNLADEILRAPSRFEKGFIVNELGQAVAELVGAVERSRAVETKLRATIADEHSSLSRLLDNAEEVARLTAELVDARDANVLLRNGSKKLRAELDRCAELNRGLVDENTALTAERDQARDALAALRGRLRPEWGYGPHSLDVVSTSSAVHAGEVARRRGEKRWTRLKTDWAEASDGD